MNTRDRALRRKNRNRFKVKKTSIPHRVIVFRSNLHIYAQVVDNSGNVLCSSSTLDKNLKIINTSNCEAAALIGSDLAEKCKVLNITKIVFDRGQFAYHGRVKSLAEAIRESGVQI